MIKVLLAEDVRMVREALASLLGLEPDIDIVATVENGNDIVTVAQNTRPDVAVIDIDLPGMDGLTAAATLRAELPECRTMILTSLGRPGNLRRALTVKVGGFLLKDGPVAALADAIRKVDSGMRVIDPQLALSAWDATDDPLTDREREVLRYAADGTSVAEIAARLSLSPGTVRNYLSSVASKLNARNRLDAVRIARSAGWI